MNAPTLPPPNSPRLEGVVSLLLTPFGADGAIDWAAYDAHVDWQAAHAPAGLFAVCGSSEMKWLSPEERLALASRAVKRAGALPVLATANLGADASAHAEEIHRMAEAGVWGVVLVPPPFSADRLRYRDYLLTLTASAPCPVVLYEWPMAPNYLMDAALFGELAEAGRVAGIKDTTCTREGIEAKQRVAGDAVVYQANAPFMLEALHMGVRGIMAITSTCRPDLVLKLWHASQSGSADAAASAAAIHRELVFLDAVLRMGYPATAKHLVALQGMRMPVGTRAPVTLSAEAAKALACFMAK